MRLHHRYGNNISNHTQNIYLDYLTTHQVKDSLKSLMKRKKWNWKALPGLFISIIIQLNSLFVLFPI